MVGLASDWQIRCLSCGATRDAAPAGVVRLGAWSWLNRTLGWCSACRWLRVLAIERKPAPIPLPAGSRPNRDA